MKPISILVCLVVVLSCACSSGPDTSSSGSTSSTSSSTGSSTSTSTSSGGGDAGAPCSNNEDCDKAHGMTCGPDRTCVPCDGPCPCVLLSDCPAPANLSCATPFCGGDGVCGMHYADTSTTCGHLGHCDGEGACVDEKPVLNCPGPCDDGNECTNDFCDTTTGQCVHDPLGNFTSCDAGKGHCNKHDETCCPGYQLPMCPGIADPMMCFASCATDPSTCSVQCVAGCPIGWTNDANDGICLPAF